MRIYAALWHASDCTITGSPQDQRGAGKSATVALDGCRSTLDRKHLRTLDAYSDDQRPMGDVPSRRPSEQIVSHASVQSQ